jgi:hypothetical protein
MNGNYADLFTNVVWLICASSEEEFTLWRYFASDSEHRIHNDISIDWKRRNPGHSIQIGTLDKRPICVSVGYVYLNGKLVVFYDGISQLVDWKMIDDWIGKNAVGIGHCNAANFNHCFDVIGVKRKGD